MIDGRSSAVNSNSRSRRWYRPFCTIRSCHSSSATILSGGRSRAVVRMMTGVGYLRNLMACLPKNSQVCSNRKRGGERGRCWRSSRQVVVWKMNTSKPWRGSGCMIGHTYIHRSRCSKFWSHYIKRRVEGDLILFPVTVSVPNPSITCLWCLRREVVLAAIHRTRSQPLPAQLFAGTTIIAFPFLMHFIHSIQWNREMLVRSNGS